MAERCIATTASGNPCAAKPLPGSDYCPWHNPDLAERRREWSVRGGKGKATEARLRKALPAALSLDELLALVSRAVQRVEQGDLDPARAQAVASLARAYAQLAQQARIVIGVEEAGRMVDAIVDAVLATDPSDELRARIVAEYERQLAARSA